MREMDSWMVPEIFVNDISRAINVCASLNAGMVPDSTFEPLVKSDNSRPMPSAPERDISELGRVPFSALFGRRLHAAQNDRPEDDTTRAYNANTVLFPNL